MQTVKTQHRLEPCKPININGPGRRYELDIAYLNDDPAKAFGVKYLLGIIDIFSRKAMIYKLDSKDSEPILTNIIEFCLVKPLESY